MEKLMSGIFGESWRSTIISILTGVAGFLSFYPEALAPLSDYWENLVRQFLIFAFSAGIISKGFVTRDAEASKKTTQRLEDKIDMNADIVTEGNKNKTIQVEVRAGEHVNMTDAEAIAYNKQVNSVVDKVIETEIVKKLI